MNLNNLNIETTNKLREIEISYKTNKINYDKLILEHEYLIKNNNNKLIDKDEIILTLNNQINDLANKINIKNED